MKPAAKLLVLLLLLGGAVLTAFGGGQVEESRPGGSRMIPPGAPEIRSLRSLGVLSGWAPPSGTAPWPEAELTFYLKHLPRTPGTAELRREITEALTPVPRFHPAPGLWADMAPTLNLELYGHTNPEEFTEESDWLYGFTRRRPFVALPVEAWITPWAYARFEPVFQKALYGELDGETSTAPLYAGKWETNILTDLLLFDECWPYRGFFSAGSEQINFTIGRDSHQWGPGQKNSLFLGNHLPYQEGFRLSAWFETFKTALLLLSFDHPDWNSLSTSVNEPSPGVSLFLAHRLEFRPRPWLVIALNEGFLYDGETFDPRYLNPVMFYHNWFTRGNSNSLVSLEIGVVPHKGWHLYTEIAMDEFRPPAEDVIGYPNALAYLGGAEWILPMGRGLLNLYIEGIYIDPWFYLRDGVDYIVHQRRYSNTEGVQILKNCLGYKYGPDSLAGVLGAAYLGGASKTAQEYSITLTYLLKGENNAETPYQTGEEAEEARSPTGIPEKRLIVETEARLPLFTAKGPIPATTLHFQGALIYITNRNHQKDETEIDWQGTMGITLSW